MDCLNHFLIKYLIYQIVTNANRYTVLPQMAAEHAYKHMTVIHSSDSTIINKGYGEIKAKNEQVFSLSLNTLYTFMTTSRTSDKFSSYGMLSEFKLVWV